MSKWEDQRQEQYDAMKASEISREREAVKAVEAAAEAMAPWAAVIWRWGDGSGGFVLDMVREAIEAHPDGPGSSQPPSSSPRRKGLPASLRTAVFERDAYRCQLCGTWTDLTIDHIIPVARGGGDDLDNLQTLRRPCNSSKGAS